jgi:hypothetical protein
VPAPEIADFVIKAVREFCGKNVGAPEPSQDECFARLKRVVITPTGIKLHIVGSALPVNPESGIDASGSPPEARRDNEGPRDTHNEGQSKDYRVIAQSHDASSDHGLL